MFLENRIIPQLSDYIMWVLIQIYSLMNKWRYYLTDWNINLNILLLILIMKNEERKMITYKDIRQSEKREIAYIFFVIFKII